MTPDDPSPESSPRDSWWNRPAGGREVLAVAMPLVISSLSWTVMTFIDRVFLYHDSRESMTAAFSAGTVWFAVMCLPLGITMYASTFVSQYFGAGRPERIGLTVWQGVWLSLLATPLLIPIYQFAPQFFSMADHGESLARQEAIYFQILCCCGPALWISNSLSTFYSGRGLTVVVMLVDTAAAATNLLLDYAWIFGEWGFPRMGIAGAAWATVVAFWLKVVIYVILLLRRTHRQKFGTWRGFRFDRALLGRILYFGGPSGLQLLLDLLGFTAFVLLVGRLGAVEAEASSMAFSVSMLAFMPVWGVSQAASILVGQHLGENRDDLASRATWTSLILAISYMSLISLLYFMVPQIFLATFFLEERTLQADQQVRTLALVLLRFVAAYSLFDAIGMVFVGALKGAGDTRYVLGVSLVLATLLIGGSWLAVSLFDWGLYGSWTMITIWIWLMGSIYLVRFLGGKWRQMRVIESPTIPLS